MSDWFTADTPGLLAPGEAQHAPRTTVARSVPSRSTTSSEVPMTATAPSTKPTRKSITLSKVEKQMTALAAEKVAQATPSMAPKAAPATIIYKRDRETKNYVVYVQVDGINKLYLPLGSLGETRVYTCTDMQGR